MTELIVGSYGIYLLLVGFNGHSKDLLHIAQRDAPGFLPWAISIGVLAIMYDNEYTKKIAQPLLYLLIITFIVKNFEVLKQQFNGLSDMAKQAAGINTGGATGSF